jgi:hypothetical protein
VLTGTPTCWSNTGADGAIGVLWSESGRSSPGCCAATSGLVAVVILVVPAGVCSAVTGRLSCVVVVCAGPGEPALGDDEAECFSRGNRGDCAALTTRREGRVLLL